MPLNKLKSKKYIKIISERPGKDKYYKLNSNKLKTEYKWTQKISLLEGITRTKKWLEENFNQINKNSLKYEHKK